MNTFGFKIKEKGSSVGKEIIAGIVLFLCTCYLIPTNASILAGAGMDEAGVYAASALVTFVSTFLFALIANVPMMLATGMGLNSLFAVTIVKELHYSWQEAMFIVLLSSIVYFILSITPARVKILNAFPSNLKKIISTGLGVFIAFVGFFGANIFVPGESMGLTLGNLTSPSVLLALGGIILILVLSLAKTKLTFLNTFAVPICILLVAAVGLILSSCGVEDPNLPSVDFTSGWGINNLEKVFLFGIFDSSISIDFVSIMANVFSNPLSYILIFSIVFTNFLNSAAVFMLIGKDTGMVNEDGTVRSNRYLLADSIGGISSAILGTSPVSSLAESAVPVAMGAKTGLTGVVASLSFLAAAFVYPIFQVFSYSSVTACALVYIGATVFMGNLKDIEWNKPEVAITAFFCIAMIIGTYSLNDGIGIAVIIYVLISLCQKKWKEIHPLLYAFLAVYLASFVLQAVFL